MYPGYVDFPGCMLWYSVAKKKTKNCFWPQPRTSQESNYRFRTKS